MSWSLVELGDLAEFINGFAFKPKDWQESGKKIIRIQNLTNPDKEYNLTELDIPNKYNVTKGDILVSWSATLDVFEWSREDALLNQHIFKVVPDYEKVNKRYFKYALKKAIDSMLKFSRGSTMKHVNRGDFLGTRIPLPPLEEQKRIAAILDKADRVRSKRQQAIDLADDFLRSVFLDMFGDPVSNPKGWKPAKMGDLIEFAKDGPHVSPKYSDSGIPFLSTRHVKPSGVVWEDLKYVSQEEADVHWKKCKPQKGDVLYTKGGTTGIACPVDFEKEFAVWVHVALVRPKPKLANHIWLTHMLNTKFCYQQSQRYTRGATNKDLGLKRMVDIEMYAPPIEEQERFVKVRENVLGLLSKFDESSSDSLFNSLSQSAFAGKL
ncbi:restriction endonuclease subunit S [Alteromonas macleodii]|uniref:restriction endonuclease subunit S n=1 Tax=Alteromonas macleodii TaxID=28108 RepID=UPI001930D745|nr:restriction endonuclease subunit S [Alteromonas macleodii]